MLARQRQERILKDLHKDGSVRVVELAARLMVSDMTIRRDLDVLQESGLLEKVHGGALLRGRSAEEPGFEAKRAREQREKEAIARAAFGLVKDGSSIALSAGTTTWYLAKLLPRIGELTVLTNSTNVALELQRKATQAVQIILIGGVFRTPSDALVGPIADAAIRSLYVDLLFLGVHGIDPELGLTTPNLAEAETNRTMMARARRVIVVADHTKWRTVGLCSFGDLSEVDVVVTDDGIESETQAHLEDQGVEVIVGSA